MKLKNKFDIKFEYLDGEKMPAKDMHAHRKIKN